MKRSTYFKVFTFCLLAFSINFFEARFIPENLVKYARFLFLLYAIVISVPHMFRITGPFTLPVKLISISITVSILAAFYSWNQGFVDSLKATVQYLLWATLFFFLHARIPIPTIEKIIMFFGLCYIMLFFYQFLNPGQVYFGWAEEFIEDRGIIRIMLPGAGVFYFTLFLALTRFSTSKNYKTAWLLLLLATMTVLVMQVTRQAIACVLILVVFHFIRNRGFFQKILILGAFTGLLVYISYSENPIVEGLMESQEKTEAEGKDYVRFVAARYFLTEFSPTTVSRVVGNGVPYGSDTSYGQFERNLWQQGIFLADVGLVAFYALFGIIAVLAYVMIWIRAFRIKVPPAYYHLQYYMAFLLGTSLTSNYIYSYSFIITTVLVLYCFTRIREKAIEKHTVVMQPGQFAATP